jgi:hypothetical protein
VKLSGLMNYKPPLVEGGKKSQKLIGLNREFRARARQGLRKTPILCLDQEGGKGTGMSALHTYFPLTPGSEPANVGLLFLRKFPGGGGQPATVEIP